MGGRYELIYQIAENSVSRVFQAFDTNLKREVAVKWLGFENAGWSSNFEDQIKLAAQLSHPNIAAFYDWGNASGTPFLVTELCRGESLKKLITTLRSPERKNIENAIFHGGLSCDQIIVIGIGAAEGLAHAHRKGMVHHRICPSNILFDYQGRVKLSDFEVAKLFMSHVSEDISKDLLGWGHYSSPEELYLLDGNTDMDLSSSSSFKSDVFSLGLVLLELAMGVPPFEETAGLTSFMTRLNEPINIPNELEGLGEVLGLALNHDPDQRPNASEFVWHLSGLEHDTATKIPIEPSKMMLQKGISTRVLKKEEIEEQNTSARQELLDRIQNIDINIDIEDFLSSQPIEISTKFKASRVGGILALLIVLATSVFTAISVIDRVSGDTAGSPIPDVVGLTTAEARERLSPNWEVKELYRRIEGVKSGQVAFTSPPSGELAKSNSIVSVTISAGEPLVLLPTMLIGLPFIEVEPRLAGLGLGLGQIKRRVNIQLLPIRRADVNPSQDILIGFDEPLGEVPWGTDVSIIVFKP